VINNKGRDSKKWKGKEELGGEEKGRGMGGMW